MSDKILNEAVATGAGNSRKLDGSYSTYQAVGATTAGSGAATVDIEVSNDETNWITLGTITLTLSTSESSDGFSAAASWPFARANVTAISGTGAYVSVYTGR